jgi:hypothetical protein
MAQKMCNRPKAGPFVICIVARYSATWRFLIQDVQTKLLKDCSDLHPKHQLPQSYLYYGPGHTISELSHTSDRFEQVENMWLSSSQHLTEPTRIIAQVSAEIFAVSDCFVG